MTTPPSTPDNDDGEHMETPAVNPLETSTGEQLWEMHRNVVSLQRAWDDAWGQWPDEEGPQ